MTSVRTLLLLSLALACTSAPPRAQLLLYVDTDAPVPSSEALGDDDPLRPAPLFDRMRIEIFAPGDPSPCAACSNEFALDQESLAGKRVSLGIELRDGKPGYRARVRVYPSRFVTGGTIPTSVTIDRWINLPTQIADTITSTHVVMSVDDVGLPADSSTPLEPTPGPPPASLVGTWHGAQRAQCVATPNAKRMCVPGGAYWAGSPTSTPAPGHTPGWHRLVTLAPFWIDTHEVTAGDFRSSGGFVGVWSGSTGGSNDADWCTYTDSGSARDVLPMNCISSFDAARFCKDHGGSLPTVAQFDYVATKLGTTPYVWGYDLPSCTDAIWGRGGYGIQAGYKNKACISTSKALGVMGGPEVAGSGTRDRITLFGVEAVDLNGNVAEWAQDAFLSESAPCMQPPILADPVCLVKGTPNEVTQVGGGWLAIASGLAGDSRYDTPFGGTAIDIGFRCVYPDQ